MKSATSHAGSPSKIRGPLKGLRISLAWVAIVFWALICVFGPALATYGANDIVYPVSFGRPGEHGLLGSDYLGRDVLSRLLISAQVTLGVTFIATTAALIVGVTLAMFSAVSGGVIDFVISRTNDVVLSIPGIMLALLIVSALGSTVLVLIGTIAIIEMTRMFRIARAAALDVLAREFVDSSRARGEGRLWIMFSDVLPNIQHVVLTDYGLRLVYALLLISSLGFLGLGVQPPLADWGMLVKENLAGVHFGASAIFIPAIAIVSVALAVNSLIDRKVASSAASVSRELGG